MAEYTKQIHYRLNNATNDIKLYTTVEDVGANYVSLMDGGATVYAGLVDPTDSLASNVRVRRNGNIYALARECSAIDPNPGLLLQRTRAGTHTTYYNVGDYFAHWIEMGKKIPNPPKIFNTNWFRTGADGKFIWPGFGDNMRVLLWILARCNGTVDAVESPIGYLPKPEDIDLEGTDIDLDTLKGLL